MRQSQLLFLSCWRLLRWWHFSAQLLCPELHFLLPKHCNQPYSQQSCSILSPEVRADQFLSVSILQINRTFVKLSNATDQSSPWQCFLFQLLTNYQAGNVSECNGFTPERGAEWVKLICFKPVGESNCLSTVWPEEARTKSFLTK